MRLNRYVNIYAFTVNEKVLTRKKNSTRHLNSNWYYFLFENTISEQMGFVTNSAG